MYLRRGKLKQRSRGRQIIQIQQLAMGGPWKEALPRSGIVVEWRTPDAVNVRSDSHKLSVPWKVRLASPIIRFTFTKDLAWGKHVDNIRVKANQQLSFAKRNIRTRSSSTKEKLCNTLVRPHIEYAATVWDPHVSKQKHSFEMVQRRAARWVTNRYHITPQVSQTCFTP